MERRTVEVRAGVEGNRLVGHASVFNEETLIRDFYERVDSRFFDRALRDKHDVVLQFDHAGLPLARTSSGTLRLGKDSAGLTIDADLADIALARDVRELVRRGDLSSMSFGFTVFEDAWSVRKDGAQLRTLVEIERLFDTSVVTFPAYAGTDVALRAEFPTPPSLPRVTARGQAARIRARIRKETS